MPTPLTARGSTKSSSAEQAMFLIFGGVPFFGLIYLIDTHRRLHFDNSVANLAVHAGLILFPLAWVVLFYAKPLNYESSDTEIILDQPKPFSCWREGWWAMCIMWATPLFALIALGLDCLAKYLPHPEDLSTSPGWAILIMLTVFSVGVFFATVLLGRSEVAPRVSEEGLRTGNLRFYKWEDIHHMAKRGDLYEIYHQVNPAIPASSFRVSSIESQAILERFFSQHAVRISNDEQLAFQALKAVVVSGFAANLVFDFWLQRNTSLSLVALIWISLGIGVVLTLVLERYRGVHKIEKYWPGVQLDGDADGDGG